jgi:cytochrome P450
MSAKRLDVNFFERAAIDNPFPLYEEIRSVGNVVWNELLQGWMAVGFNECSTVLTDRGEQFTELNGDPELIFWFDAPNMITVDGPEHRRLRGALAPLFTRSAVAKLEQRVEAVVDQLLTPLGASSEFDLADFTMIPTVIVAEMLGVPKERHQDFRRWSHEIVSNLSYGHEDAQARDVMRRAATEVNSYLREEIERHRRDQPDDLLTKMVNLPGDNAMTDEEIRSTAVLLLIAGYDTTAKTMANCLIALETHPDERRLVAHDPALIPDAVEEVLRWSGPVQFMPRLVMVDTALDDTKVAAGDVVFVFAGAANRDPRRWTDPRRFDTRREVKSHLAFGWGPHLCIGAPLARLETKVALQRLLQVAPEYRLRDIDFGNSFFVRGPERGLVDVAVHTTP